MCQACRGEAYDPSQVTALYTDDARYEDLRVTLPLAVFVEVVGDRIRHETHYYDATTLLTQMTTPAAPQTTPVG